MDAGRKSSSNWLSVFWRNPHRKGKLIVVANSLGLSYGQSWVGCLAAVLTAPIVRIENSHIDPARFARLDVSSQALSLDRCRHIKIMPWHDQIGQ